MGWKDEVKKELRRYGKQRYAPDNITLRIREIDMEMTSIKGAKIDGDPVKGGTSQREERILTLIMEKSQKIDTKQIIIMRNERIERVLKMLPENERKVLTIWYIEEYRNPLNRLMDDMNYAKDKVYNLRDDAMKDYALTMYGLLVD